MKDTALQNITDPTYYLAMVERSQRVASVRQAAAWGMRGIQGVVFGRLGVTSCDIDRVRLNK